MVEESIHVPQRGQLKWVGAEENQVTVICFAVFCNAFGISR
jgi:hypothetical protein